jgi:hypothetical protein
VSLKAFHVVFIVASTLLSVAFGLWSIAAYRGEGEALYLGLGIFSFLVAAGLIVYFSYFLKKMKDVSYL